MSGSGTGTPISVLASFVAEDGTGLSNANSYLSVADADTYHANVTQSGEWTAATQAARENGLIVATQYLENKYRGRWRGRKKLWSQALAWPRYGAVDDDGYAIDSEAVPQELQAACAELALRVVLGDNLLGVVTEPGEVTSESVSVGPVTESKTYAGGKPHGYQYPKVEALLRAVTQAGGRVIRG